MNPTQKQFSLNRGASRKQIPISSIKGLGASGIDFANKTSVFVGNSVTAGSITSDPSLRWTSLFCSSKSGTEDNLGVSGMTMQANTCPLPYFDPANIPVYNSGDHAALFIDLGTNDCGINIPAMTPAGFKTAYTTAVQFAINTRGWPANLIILINLYQPFSFDIYATGVCGTTVAADGIRAAAYNLAVQEVANENGCYHVDMYTAMTGLSAAYFNADELHPNDAGHAFIANYLKEEC